jgi:hypothetical protein
MPDIQIIMENKDLHVAALKFQIGCSESAYWLASFLVQSIFSIVPYLGFSLLPCFGFGLIGTDFSLFHIIINHY